MSFGFGRDAFSKGREIAQRDGGYIVTDRSIRTIRQ